eukprot:2172124-Pyramimonas_sp.AAC.1
MPTLRRTAFALGCLPRGGGFLRGSDIEVHGGGMVLRVPRASFRKGVLLTPFGFVLASGTLLLLGRVK